MVTAAAVIGLLLGVPLGRLADRMGRKRILFVLAPVYWIGNLLLVWSSRPASLVLVGVFQGAFTMTSMLTQAIAVELAPSERTSDWLAVTKFFKMVAVAAMASVAGRARNARTAGPVWGKQCEGMIPWAVRHGLRSTYSRPNQVSISFCASFESVLPAI